jgi:hypothetical protein
MRYRFFLAIAAAVALWAWPAGAAEAPRSIAGLTLGQPIEDAADRVFMQTSLPVRYMENLREVEIRPVEGFKSGLIAYGTCRRPQVIVRIKLKYADGSRAFYDDLLKRYKARLGNPDEYRGDPFGVFVSWKWSFTDAQGDRISLTLQHNQDDEEEKLGNAVKLTLLNRLEEDAGCARQQPDPRRDLTGGQQTPDGGSPEWDRLVPKR